MINLVYYILDIILSLFDIFVKFLGCFFVLANKNMVVVKGKEVKFLNY